MKADEHKTNMYLVAIISVVAIVALVVLVLLFVQNQRQGTQAVEVLNENGEVVGYAVDGNIYVGQTDTVTGKVSFITFRTLPRGYSYGQRLNTRSFGYTGGVRGYGNPSPR